jgi:tetratricopeptide (TPR) repeat protein
MRAFAVFASLLGVGVTALSAQQKWVGPQSPCDIKTGYFRLNSVVVDLQKATEQPQLRDRMLSQAQDVLIRSIRDDKQDKNPAAWYYLGRYYVMMQDGAGADTAFTRAVALAPQCKADADGYRQRLAEAALTRGLTAWQAGNRDSAALLLRQAYALDPSSPRALFQLGAVYLDGGQNDSAVAVLREAARAAGADTAYAGQKRDALLTVARLAFADAQGNPAVQKWQHTRYSRDSLAPNLAADSTVLAKMLQSSASRRARKARLAPADQQAFTRDSAARADGVERGRAMREVLAQQAVEDSTAAQAAYQPVIDAYQAVAKAYPADPDVTTSLAAVYSQAGRPGEAMAVFDTLFAHSAALSARQLHSLAQRLVQARLMEPAIEAYTLVLQRNPYDRNVLAELTRAYVEQKDSSNALATAQRLQGIDPLNKVALGLVSQGWSLKGKSDSASAYGTLADTLPVDVTIASMVGDTSGVTVTGIATNLGQKAAPGFHLTVEFLNAQGTVVDSKGVDIGALAAGAHQQFEAKGSGTGIVGWRYRRS